MGYLVHDGEVPEMFAPCLEDPADPLTADRLITRDPAAWWRQPLPWCLDWTSPIMFPRACWFAPDVDPWFPAPDDRVLPEVRRGFVGADLHLSRCPGGTVDARFFQGASHGLVITPPRTGHALSISGMHPEFELLEFRLPADRAENPVRDRRHRSRPAGPAAPYRLPAERRAAQPGVRRGVSAAARFRPGVHKHIPVRASLDGDMTVDYQPPEPVRERIAALLARKEGRS